MRKRKEMQPAPVPACSFHGRGFRRRAECGIIDVSESSRRLREMRMKNDNHRKKMVAPIVITVVFLVYLAVYGLALAKATAWSPVMILPAIPLVGLGIGMVYVLKERIHEIRSGEEDDLSNY